MSVPRVLVRAALTGVKGVQLSARQSHHLRVVLRRPPDSPVLVFNDVDGEWAGRLHMAGSTAARVQLDHRVRNGLPPGPPWARGPLLVTAPLDSREAQRFLVEKAVELGVGGIVSLICERAQRNAPSSSSSSSSSPFLYEAGAQGLGAADSEHPFARLQAWSIGAAEQCGRLDAPPILSPALTLAQLLVQWQERRGSLPPHRLLLACDEGVRSEGARLHTALAAWQGSPEGAPGVESAVGILVGPEGGWSPAEAAALAAAAAGRKLVLKRVSLGPRVLRAETAALAALTEASLARDGVQRRMT